MTLRDTHIEIAAHCGEIAKYFKAGAKVSVIVRNPGVRADGSADMFVSDDEPDSVIESLQRLKTRPEEKITDADPR